MPVALRSTTTLDLERRRGVDLLGHQLRTANAQKSVAWQFALALHLWMRKSVGTREGWRAFHAAILCDRLPVLDVS